MSNKNIDKIFKRAMQKTTPPAPKSEDWLLMQSQLKQAGLIQSTSGIGSTLISGLSQKIILFTAAATLSFSIVNEVKNGELDPFSNPTFHQINEDNIITSSDENKQTDFDNQTVKNEDIVIYNEKQSNSKSIKQGTDEQKKNKNSINKTEISQEVEELNSNNNNSNVKQQKNNTISSSFINQENTSQLTGSASKNSINSLSTQNDQYTTKNNSNQNQNNPFIDLNQVANDKTNTILEPIFIQKEDYKFPIIQNQISDENISSKNDSIHKNLKKSNLIADQPRFYLKPYFSFNHEILQKSKQLQSINNQTSQSFNYSIGLFMGFKLYKNLYLESGVLYTKGRKINQSFVGINSENSEFYHYNYNTNLLSIPLKLRYDYTKPFITLYFSGGGILNYQFNSNQNTYQHIDLINYLQYDIRSSKNKINFEIAASTGIQFKATPNLSFFIEPEFRYSINRLISVKDYNPIYNPKKHTFSFGTGIIYKLR